MFYSYILVSNKTTKHYYGHCSDLEKRLSEHNRGKTPFTRPFRPWRVHFQEMFETKSDAYRREMFYKSMEGYAWLKDNGII